MRSKDGFFSPRSIRPRCFTSTSTFSATCHIFNFRDFLTERRRLPNLDSGVIGVDRTIAKQGPTENALREHYSIDKEACGEVLSYKMGIFPSCA